MQRVRFIDGAIGECEVDSDDQAELPVSSEVVEERDFLNDWRWSTNGFLFDSQMPSILVLFGE